MRSQNNMRSEDRKLLPGDISRKRKKLDKTLSQLEGLKEGTRKHYRKMFKAEKTLDQLQTGKSGIRPTKGFFEPASPLKQENDSIAAAKAWKDFRKSYMDRKFKGNDERLGPITATENEDEYNREKNEFYYDIKSKKLKLIPTDDGEVQNRSGIQKWQLAPSMKTPIKREKKRGEAGFQQDPQEAREERMSRQMDQDRKRLHAVSSITDKAIKEQDYPGQVGVDLGTIKKKSALNMLGIKSPLNKISGPCKAAAKKKFKVWPSAYASGWGVRCTKAGGPSNYGGGKKK
jgi:hypothetical protein